MPSTFSELIGPVSSALPYYDYREVPPEAQSNGEAAAMGVASRWLESMLNAPFRPALPLRQFVHQGDAGTCDAVQHQFRPKTDGGEIALSVFQTQFIVLVAAVLGHAAAGGVQLANEFGRWMFKHNGRLNLVLVKQDATGAFGEQVSNADPANNDWLDTMAWWTDGRAICYQMLKRTGAGQSAIVSSLFEANHTWFAAFERPRAR